MGILNPRGSWVWVPLGYGWGSCSYDHHSMHPTFFSGTAKCITKLPDKAKAALDKKREGSSNKQKNNETRVRVLEGRGRGLDLETPVPLDNCDICDCKKCYPGVYPPWVWVGVSISGTLQKTHTHMVRVGVSPQIPQGIPTLISTGPTVFCLKNRDQGILRLLKNLGQVYNFMMQDKTLGGIPSMQGIIRQIVQQTLECSQFIKDYSATKNFCEESMNYCALLACSFITYPLLLL
ncbi:uncharacterized protein F5147DRAFT_656115 [Suillus discolor]|uniref:Uncharacterized protein n=1 Tax=Suillus discolor TaxID=1912936 RepID=A0A9P7JQH6_9AGAM|nr:uncharacterized protein F5147DRAFT_656115 [Suillus discolor]KAG2098224.1 hypothetical protein F5147DRAFT_656115 [Suillus discolor]